MGIRWVSQDTGSVARFGSLLSEGAVEGLRVVWFYREVVTRR